MERLYKVRQINTDYMGFSNYCYIIVDKSSSEACIIDPAWELNKIEYELGELGANLTSILLTHSHYDHVNLLNPLLRRFNPSVFMSKKEIDYYGFKCRNLNELDDMDAVETGKTKITCILTPGHTYGGMCYLLQDSMFTGDTIFTEGCGICSSCGGSPKEMFKSIQKVKSIIPSHVRIYPAHSYGKEPGYTLDYLNNNNIYFLLDNEEHFVDFRMRRNQIINSDLMKAVEWFEMHRLYTLLYGAE